jgi:hypothetical protein
MVITVKKKSKKQLKIVLAVVLVAVLILLPLFQVIGLINVFAPFAVSDYHTGINPSTINNMNTKQFWQDCWQGQAVPGTGYPNREMLTDTKYVTAFKDATGSIILSERINIVGNMFEDDLFESSYPTKGYYNVYLLEDPTSTVWTQIVGLNWYSSATVRVTGGTGWRTCNVNPIGLFDQEIWISPMEIQLIGSHVGALKVEAVYDFASGVNPFASHWQKTMSCDYAYLISGEGRINIQGYQSWETPMYEIGETVPIQVSADYSGPTIGGNGRWQLWAFPLRGGSGRLLKEWNYDYFRETFYWSLPADAWVRGASDSKWRIELRNTLFSTDAIKVNTIDVRANAPPTPTIIATPENPQLGDPVAISISVNTNQYTHETILKFWVSATQTATNTQFIYKSVAVDSGSADPYTATTTVSSPQNAGEVYVEVWAHDEAGRESAVPGTATITWHEGRYRLALTVIDEYNSLAIENVRVQQTGGSIKYTDIQGKCWFDLNQGSYAFQFTKAGYRAKTGSWELSNSDRDEIVYMTRTTNTWDLTVTVQTKDGSTVWGAQVNVGALQMTTDTVGTCVFSDLPEGEYVVTAKDGNLEGSKQVNLDRSQSISITITKGGNGDVGEIDWLLIGGITVAVIIVLAGVYMYYREKRGKKK